MRLGDVWGQWGFGEGGRGAGSLGLRGSPRKASPAPHQTQTSLVHRGDYGWKPITSSDPETLKKKPLDFVGHVGLVEGFSVIAPVINWSKHRTG